MFVAPACILMKFFRQNATQLSLQTFWSSIFVILIGRTMCDDRRLETGTVDTCRIPTLIICVNNLKTSSIKNTFCTLRCYDKLTVQLVSFCRSQYVLFPTFKKRNAFLDKQIQMKPEGKKKRLYFVQQSNGEQLRVCSKAWFISYGGSPGTFKAKCRLRNSRSNEGEKHQKGWFVRTRTNCYSVADLTGKENWGR